MNEELNKKLLYFAGLHRNEPTGGFWWDAEGNLIFDFHKPDERGFTESLDACFKLLVPKVARKLANIDLSTDREAMYKLFSLWIEGFWLPREQPISLALALCLAIENLIDGEK